MQPTIQRQTLQSQCYVSVCVLLLQHLTESQAPQPVLLPYFSLISLSIFLNHFLFLPTVIETALQARSHPYDFV